MAVPAIVTGGIANQHGFSGLSHKSGNALADFDFILLDGFFFFAGSHLELQLSGFFI